MQGESKVNARSSGAQEQDFNSLFKPGLKRPPRSVKGTFRPHGFDLDDGDVEKWYSTGIHVCSHDKSICGPRRLF